MSTPNHIGVSGQAPYRGIPNATVAWTALAAHTLTIFGSIDKSSEADVKMLKNNQGQTFEMNRTDPRFKVKFSAKPVGANAAAAQAIAADLPQKMDVIVLTNAVDAQMDTTSGANTCVLDSASAKWSPEGELTVDIEATIWVGVTYVAFS